MLGLFALAVLIGWLIVWRRKVRNAALRREQRLLREVESPDRFSMHEAKLPLPKFQALEMRPELSQEFCDQAQKVFGPAGFVTNQPRFLRVAVYYLASLEKTFQSAGFQFVDWGELPTELPGTIWENLVRSMADHMRLERTGFEVEFGSVEDNTAGHIVWPERDDLPARVTLSTELADHFAAAVKVLSHELSHQMMHLMGFNHSDNADNERLTDITSLYVGFFKYIIEGITYIKGYDSAFSWTTATTGYLSAYEMCYLYRLISAIHGELDVCAERLSKSGRMELSRSRWIKGLMTLPMDDSEMESMDSEIRLLRQEFSKQETELTRDIPVYCAVQDLLKADKVLLNALERESQETCGTVAKALSVLWKEDLRLLKKRCEVRRNFIDRNGVSLPDIAWQSYDVKMAVVNPTLNTGVMSASERLTALIEMAESGDADAQFELALRYMEGRGCNQSDEQAIHWYQQAAEGGSIEAQNNLAVIHSRMGNKSEAAQWYLRSANNGNTTAQLNYAYCLQDGDGVPEDHAESAKWFLEAAQRGECIAQLEYGYCCLDGDGRQEDVCEAVNWFKKAADQGLAAAQNQLGICYRDGIGVDRNQNTALDWFRLAAGQRDPEGLFNLGECHWYGRGVPVNRDEAIEWYRDAADSGCESATKKLESLLQK